jgi:HK97 family phage portal protein
MGLMNYIREKLNPAQQQISWDEGSNLSTTTPASYRTAFNNLEAVNRGVNMIVGACASLDYDIDDKKVGAGMYPGMRAKQLVTLLNNRPNPYQSVQDFRACLFNDFLLEGNAFIYFDGAFLYHLPAASVEVLTDEKTFISGYRYGSNTLYDPNEVTYFRDLSSNSIYRGMSRLTAADRNIKILTKMLDFQDNFFENGAIPGFALATDNTLSSAAKERTINNWIQKYNPKRGAKRPIIIDSGLKPVQLFTTNFKEMDFDVSIKTLNVKILETLGVPPVLLDGGNQANISPNLRLFYLETVLPIVRKFASSMELLFGYDIEAITTNVSALQPELKDISAYYVGLVNGGIISVNTAREELRYPKDKDPNSDTLRIPANIAGSAADPNVGGRPKTPPKEDENT